MDNIDLPIVEPDALKEFVLKGRDISAVKERAEIFSSFIERRLSVLPKDKGYLYLSEIHKLCCSLRPSQDIHLSWASMDELVDDPVDMEGVIFTVRGTDGSAAYFIYLNQRIRLLANQDDACSCPDVVPVDEFAAKSYWQTLRQVYLHEISHLLLRHGDAGLLVSPIGDVPDSGIPLQEMCSLASRLYQRVRVQQDFDCEVFSMGLAFWPLEKFTRRVMYMLKNWNESGGIRAKLSNAFRMPVNATVQWLAIMFGDKLGVHYIRRNEESKEWLDWLDVNKNLNLFVTHPYSGNNVFACKGTAAYKAATERRDTKTRQTNEPFFCEALYSKKQSLFNMRFDEIVVVGFQAQKVQEELNVFSAGISQ